MRETGADLRLDIREEAVAVRDGVAATRYSLVSKAITSERQVIDVFTVAGSTPSPPDQPGSAQRSALSVSLASPAARLHDALRENESALRAFGVPEFKVIAAELITKARQSVTIDWTLRESARAKIRVIVKRNLNKHGYPPDLQEEAVKPVLQQAELLRAEFV